jgi:nickel-type superoxide dismutase maturation protease
MRPTLAPGDLVLVDPRAYRADRPRRGEVVVARHPFRADLRLVKRVVATREDGRCVLAGDDRGASTDSRTLGAVPGSLILGRVVARLGGRDVPRT